MKKIRFFGGFLILQERWLNLMVKKGWRLNKVQGHRYSFIKCKPEEFDYCVDCIIKRSTLDAKEYINFLNEIGYKTFQTGINFNISAGKMKWRIGGSKLGHIDTNPGKYNKEILIVEKRKDEKPFRLHTSKEDTLDYYRSLRNSYLPVALLSIVVLIDRFFLRFMFESLNSITTVFLFVLILVFIIPILLCECRIIKIYKNRYLEE
ncbi:DUF2812 domain-containing protein [Lacrimispora sp.]|uniref:DUF2812 domain-containing protein n=1 Tax=Lacrimispora sp. TaxID=2719234 RepID=UPI0032E3F4E9